MFWLIVGIIAAIGLFVFLGIMEIEVPNEYRTERKTVWKFNKAQLIALLPLLLCIFSFFTKIPVNSVGIVYSPFGGTKEQTLSEGFAWKSPLDKVYKITTEVQTMTIEGLTTQTKDAQYLTTALDIKYKVNNDTAFMVFKQFRTLDKMSENLIVPVTQKQLELVTTRYNVIDILGESRSSVYVELEYALTCEFAKYGVEFVSITINDMDAGAELEAAISAEAVAKKAVETAEQALKKAEIDAKQKSVQALADQEAAKIKAETLKIEAQAEKEANELLAKSLDENILIQMWIEAWNGVVPTYYGGNGADLIFNTGTLE